MGSLTVNFAQNNKISIFYPVRDIFIIMYYFSEIVAKAAIIISLSLIVILGAVSGVSIINALIYQTANAYSHCWGEADEYS